MLFMVDCYKIRLIVIGLAINLATKLVIETHYCFHRSDFHKSGWSLRQFILLMNCTLDSTIYLVPNTVMIAKLFNHKFRFIYYFKIAHYQERSSFNRESIEKL